MIRMYDAVEIYIIFVIIFVITLFLTMGGFILQREKYWRRVWENLGEPEVKNIKELKSYASKQYNRP